jgi:putative phage-type endonuclease
MMEIHNLVQGSPEWHAHRAQHFNASDAPAMMGVSPYKTRTQLLDELVTGIVPEVDAYTQQLFDEGHRFEALARPLAEQIIGEALYPVTGSVDKYSASFDGLTMAEDINWEHKKLNADLRAVMVDGCTGADLPLLYQIQMEHQSMVSGAEKTLFMASEWDADGNLIEERHCWYTPNMALRQDIINGWAQLEKDRETHVPKVIAEKPKAEVVIELPTLFVHAKGEITESNMKEFGAALAERLEAVRAIKLVTDQDFANAKAAAKMFRDQITKLKAAKEAMLSQTVTIGEAARMIDTWSEDLRVTALQLEKDVEREDLAKKRAMVMEADNAFTSHVRELEAEVMPILLNVNPPAFAEAIKGKRNYASMQDAVDTMLSQAKSNADQVAKDIREKLAWCDTNAEGYGFLFADLPQIIHKPMDDFQLLITSRIDQHKKAEEERLEAERERIRQEEEIKARAAAAQEQAKREAEALAAKMAEDAAAKDAEQSKQAIATPATETVQTGLALVSANDEGVSQSIIPTKEVVDDGSTMKLGDIAALLGFPLSAQFIEEELGIKPAGKERTAVLFNCRDFPAICDCLVANVNAAKVDFIEQRKAA